MLCERISNTAETLALTDNPAWGLITLETACIRDMLPGGQSEGDPLEPIELARHLTELAARRGTPIDEHATEPTS